MVSYAPVPSLAAGDTVRLADLVMGPAPQLLSARRHGAPDADVEDSPDNLDKAPEENKPSIAVASGSEAADHSPTPGLDGDRNVVRPTRIKFDPSTEMPKDNSTLYIPGPQDRERGEPSPRPLCQMIANVGRTSHCRQVRKRGW